MTYIKTQWTNDNLPAIDADNLNKIEDGIESVDTAIEGHLVNVGTSVDSGYRVNFLKGKNLFDLDKFFNGAPVNNCTKTKTSTGITISYSSGVDAFIGYTYNSGTIASGIQPCLLEVKPKTTYTLSSSNTFKNSSYICYADRNYNVLNTSYIQIPDNTTYTFTTPANTKYVLFRLGIYNDSGTSYTFNNLMLNEGETALPYEPYITPTINVDGDEIYKQDNLDIIDVTSKITLNSGYSIANGKIYKQGKHIFGQITIKGTTPTTQQTIGTIAYPPKSYVTISGTITTSNDEWGIPSGWCYVYLGTSGNIQIVANTQGQALRFDVDYCIAD